MPWQEETVYEEDDMGKTVYMEEAAGDQRDSSQINDRRRKTVGIAGTGYLYNR